MIIWGAGAGVSIRWRVIQYNVFEVFKVPGSTAIKPRFWHPDPSLELWGLSYNFKYNLSSLGVGLSLNSEGKSVENEWSAK